MTSQKQIDPNAGFSRGGATGNVRDLALEGVTTRSQTKEGGGRLKGKVGVITGVGPAMGIGTAAARLFAREGAAHLYLLDFQDTHLPGLVAELEKSFSTKITSIKADAADHKAISSLVNRVMEEEGRLDFFFANAGISVLADPKLFTVKDDVQRAIGHLKGLAKPISEVKEDEFERIMRINALSVFIAIKYASVAMAKSNPAKGKTIPGGSIILTASVAGLKANAGPIAYSASKAAVVSMAQTASYELTGQNIRVNAICPGLIQTDMTSALFGIAKATGKEGKVGVLNPLLRQGLAVEVAHAALFLASDDSSYVNGQALPVDGGLSSSLPYVRARI